MIKHSKHTYKKVLKDCRIYYSDSTIDEIYNYKLDYTYKYKIKGNNHSITATIPVDTKIIEIDASNVPCIAYSNFNISIPYDQITFYNVIPYKDKNIFYNDQGVIRIEGDFKKGEKLILSCDYEYLDDIEKIDFIEYLCKNLIILSEEYELEKNRKINVFADKIRNIRNKIRLKKKRK